MPLRTCAPGSRASRAWASCSTSRGAHWDLEIGAISEINYRRKPSAALLFDDIVGYPRGYRVLTGSLEQRAPDGGDARARPEARHGGAGAGAARQAASVGSRRAAVRAGVRRVRADPRERRPGAATSTSRRFPRRAGTSTMAAAIIGTGVAVVTSDPDTGPHQRRRLPDDDPGGRPFRDDQRRGGEAGARAVRSLVREARQGAGPGVVRPRSAAADGGRHRGAEHDQRVRLRRRDGRRNNRASSSGEVTGLPMPAGAEIVVEGWIRPDRVLSRGTVRRVDRLLLGFAQAGSDDRHRAAVFPERPDHPRRRRPASRRTTTRTCGRC